MKMNKSNVEKWRDGSIVDEWLKSKSYRKFHTYHPYLTFSDPLNDCFVEPNGKHGKELNPDTQALFDIGREVYKRMPDCTKEDFDQAYSSHWDFIDDLRQTFQKMESDGKLKSKNEAGKEMTPLWDDLSDDQVLDVAWQIFPKIEGENSKLMDMLGEAYLFHAFHEIDNAIIGIFLDGREAIAAAIAAANALANLVAIESGNDKLQEARRDIAYRGALARIAADPKQKEKVFVFGCWQEWQRDPSRYNGKAAFARDMLTKCEHLTSQKKIEDWCRGWEAENRNPAG